MTRADLKKKRQEELLENVRKNPFIKDDELSDALGVSIATIRMYRTQLGIEEYRERVKKIAKKNESEPLFTDMLDLNLYHDGISVLDTDDTMTYDGTDLVKGQILFSLAENLAMSVIDAKSVLITVANVKYFKEVKSGDRLLAKFEVKRTINSEYIIWVRIKVKTKEVFRTKFKLELRESNHENSY